MELRSVHVRNFKSVTDSNTFTIEPDVTCLVGKNESGKTALLESLYRLNPLQSGHPTTFQALRDYPRRYYGRDKEELGGKTVVEATLEMSHEEIAEIEGQFGKHVLPSPIVRVHKGYGNKLYWSDAVDESAALQHVLGDKRLAGVDLDGVTTLEDLRTRIDEVDEPPGPLADLKEELAGEDPLGGPVRQALAALLPEFLYFGDYSSLPGRVSIEKLQDPEADLTPGERTALSLLRLAGVDSAEFTESNYEARKAALEAAANTLTDEVFEYWRQNTQLQVELDIEFEKRGDTREDPHPDPEPILQIRIRNDRHRVTLNLEGRSAGFVWFFSFLAYFSEFERSERPIVLLLDEPALNLHAMAQEDLLRFIEERLAPRHQVVYTSHSPFMVDPKHLERVRLVEDRDRIGTVVSDDALDTNEETQFPIHAAIGVQATQTLFIGAHNLIVEGNADMVYLQVMSGFLEEQGRTALDPRWVVTPVGGLDKMPTFLALLGPQVHIAALHDVPRTGTQRLDDLVDKGVVDAKQLVPLTEFTGTKEADIEDLFDVGFYLELLRHARLADVTEDELRKGGRIVKRVEHTLGHPFSHYAPARHLAAHRQELLSKIDDATISRFEKVVGKLNDLIE